MVDILNVHEYDEGLSISIHGKNRNGHFVLSVCDLTKINPLIYDDLKLPPNSLLYDFNRIVVGRNKDGMGVGTRLMRKLVELADIKSFYIVGYINPYGRMNYEELADWYEKYGFEVDREKNFFIRIPRID